MPANLFEIGGISNFKIKIMTKKEEQPKRDRDDNFEESSENFKFDPDITKQDKETLNNQSEKDKGDYFKGREDPVDFAGEDLDLPEMDEKKFNQTANKPDESEKEERPKKSANSNDNIESETETIYKGEKAEKYKDPSKK